MDATDNSLTAPERPAAEHQRRFFLQAFGWLLGAASLAWVLHDVHPREVWRSLAGLNWGWVALAIVFDIQSYVCQGWRWRLLLKPVGEIGTLRATQAIYAGLFTNEVLPMRLGEIVRAYLVSRWLPAPFPSVIPSLVVERLFDAVWLAICIAFTAMFVPLPKDLLKTGDTLGILTLLGTGVFLYFVIHKRNELVEPAAARGCKPVRRLWSLLGHLEQGLRKIGLSRSFYAAFGLSLAFLLGQILAFWLIMIACGLRLSFWIGTVVLLIVHLGTAIPNAPANVGTYQFFVVVGLALFGIDKAPATGFSFVVFFLLTLPLWALGFLALSRCGMTLASIRKEVVRLAA